MNTAVVVIITLSFTCVFAYSMYVINRKLQKLLQQQDMNTQLIMRAECTQLDILRLHGEMQYCNLWKIRQEIYNWQCKWSQEEHYEAAKNAKIMVEKVEELIDLYVKINEEYDTEND